MIIRTLALAALLAGLASAATGAPALRGEVTIIGPIVTIGDMFEDAGEIAERGLFRSPLPGTTGTVTLEEVRQAARAAGLTDYTADGVIRVRVTRPAIIVDAAMLSELVAGELNTRGAASANTEFDISFSQPPAFAAEAVDKPVALLSLNYALGNTGFAARFVVAGRDAPVEVTGHVRLMTRAPHLVATLPAGAIVGPDDIEMRLVPRGTADFSAAPDLAQLIGRQLTRQSRAGMMLKPTDVAEPRVIARNAVVTMLLDAGPMRLTAKGQALSNAAAGEPLQVINTASRKIVTGIAQPDGTVVVSSHMNVAGL